MAFAMLRTAGRKTGKSFYEAMAMTLALPILHCSSAIHRKAKEQCTVTICMSYPFVER